MKRFNTTTSHPNRRRSAATDPEIAMVVGLLARLKAGGDLRKAKVRRVRAALRQQAYFNTLKLDVAADRRPPTASHAI
ncbi:MAG TPA: hypothetical protein VIM11_09445 [Tepidisphaeraceae bacterium]|jgi:uncharacterized protein YcgL (UPF0745 family)